MQSENELLSTSTSKYILDWDSNRFSKIEAAQNKCEHSAYSASP